MNQLIQAVGKYMDPIAMRTTRLTRPTLFASPGFYENNYISIN